MPYILDAACLCNTGKVRTNNEDNFLFDGQCLEAENNGLDVTLTMTGKLRNGICLAVFDGMGGENYGEYASFAAADCMKFAGRKFKDFFIPLRRFIYKMCMKANDAVLSKQQELGTDRMGSTMVALYFSRRSAYVCNLGDSRAYRLRNGELQQLSEDHILKRNDDSRKKTPLTQHLGISDDFFIIEPFIAEEILEAKDQFLICSDGLTDMLDDSKIKEIMNDTTSAVDCVNNLISSALEKGGRDNVTAVVCRIR